ncbi:MAG: glycosyltransferase [Anaerolineales bacterium]|nr:glycosyltransferase [Anaerolineales bacterium]
MDVLFVVPYVPNLIRVRPYNFIRYLGRRGHRVTVLTLWSDEQEHQDIARLREECHAVRAVRLPRWRSAVNSLLAVPTHAPVQSAYCWQPELLADQRLEGLRPDVVHVEHLRGARFALALRQWQRRQGRPTPVVWDSVDCISLLFRHAAARSRRWVSRLITRFELGRTERYEGWLLGQFDRTLVTSRIDREALLALAESGQAGPAAAPDLRVIPNGVDLGYFAPAPDQAREPATLVLSGKMSYHANVTMAVHFAQEILPRVRAHRPDVKLWVVGKEPAAEVRALAADPAITVTGTVPDMRPYLQQATLAVAPVAYGVGIQNKVLEAMACGAPVVASPQSVSALDLQPGRDVQVAEQPEAFAAAILNLLNDPAQRAALGRAGRRYVETHHDWATIAARLEEAYQGAPERAAIGSRSH